MCRRRLWQAFARRGAGTAEPAGADQRAAAASPGRCRRAAKSRLLRGRRGAERFSSIVGMDDLKKTIRLKIIEPFLNPGLFQRFRKESGGGICLWPPGCGKTIIAPAVANERECRIHLVGIFDVLNMWLGESERNLASLFDKAQSAGGSRAALRRDRCPRLFRSKAHSEHILHRRQRVPGPARRHGPRDRSVLILATNMPGMSTRPMKILDGSAADLRPDARRRSPRENAGDQVIGSRGQPEPCRARAAHREFLRRRHRRPD